MLVVYYRGNSYSGEDTGEDSECKAKKISVKKRLTLFMCTSGSMESKVKDS